KQQVRSVATLSSGGLAMEQTGPVSMDFDLAAGDQQDREGEGAVTGATFELQLNVDGAPEMRGWSVRIEYDPTQVRYVPNSFRGSSFLSGLVPLVGEKSRRVDVGGAVLGSDATAQGNGELGTVSFEILDGFSGRAEVVITQVSFNTTESGEVIEQVRATATFSDATVGPTGDFSGDGQVDFSDFFLFADHFGFGEGDAGYDATYDLNASGEVDFSDFFIFADSFNVGIQGKLMALAREYIGLPEVSSVEQNYPNPFNGATTIAYHVVRPGPVQLDIYDIGGQRVQQLADGFHATGSYRAVWDGTNRRGRAMASGVYFYALRAEGVQQLRKMLYVK
ncbi:MAG: FlgD immunoglobulin-like domain containing protein, partial [Candidatus Latescibacterota bacterium]|nr:FlgD immunoglobulin-like domain containing protein [Candidatus Latescibacterota bacterium]